MPRDQFATTQIRTPAAARSQGTGERRAEIASVIVEATPVVRARVARTLLRCSRLRGTGLEQACLDIVQDVLADLCANDARIIAAWSAERGRSLAGYIGIIAERRAMNACRAKRTRAAREQLVADHAEHGSAHTFADERRVQARDLIQKALQRRVQTCSERAAEILVRLFLEEQTPAEVATAVGVSLNAVYQWRHRLRAALRDELQSIAAERSTC